MYITNVRIYFSFLNKEKSVLCLLLQKSLEAWMYISSQIYLKRKIFAKVGPRIRAAPVSSF